LNKIWCEAETRGAKQQTFLGTSGICVAPLFADSRISGEVPGLFLT